MPSLAPQKKRFLPRTTQEVQFGGTGKNMSPMPQIEESRGSASPGVVRGSLLANATILAVLFAVFAPTTAFATDNWCATYRTNGMRGTVTTCFSSESSCKATTRVAKLNQEANPPTGVLAVECFDKTQQLTSEGQKRAVGVIVEEQRRETMSGNPIFGGFSWLLAPLNWIAQIVFYVAGIFLTYMAKIMSWSISVSIDSTMLGSLTFVNKGWTAIRDFANMFFIFGLLYIAIQTILGLAGGNTKRALAHIIIAALLVNFSLFATKVVIDAGNILAVSIWSKIQTQPGPAQMDSASKVILGGLDLQTIFNRPENKATLKAMGNGEEMLVHAGGAIFMFIAGYIFLAAALMMITRTIMLLLLMIFSPFAFMSFGLPKMEQYGHKWLDKLLKQTFVAPFFIFMLYLNSIIINSGDLFSMSGSKGQSFFGSFTGSGEYQIIFNFILMIGFLIASLSIANSFAGDVGSHARGWATKASKWAGGLAAGGAVAGTAWGMRQTLGRVGQRTAENKELDRLSKEGNWAQRRYANIAIGTGKALKGGTFDIRNTKMGTSALGAVGIQAGTGTQKTYGKTGATWGTRWAGGTIGTEQIEKWAKEAKELHPGSAEAQEKLMQDRMNEFSFLPKGKDGKPITKDFYSGEGLTGDAAKKMKEVRDGINREKVTEKAKKNLKDNIKAYADDEKSGLIGKDEIIDGKATGKKIGDAAATAITEALAKLNGKEAADTLDNDQLKLKPVIEALNNQHLAALNARTDINPDTIAMITNGIVANGTNSAQKYLRNQSRLSSGNGLFQVDAEKELEQLTKDYNETMLKFNNTATRTPEVEEKVRDMKTKAGRLLGMMETSEIAELDNTLITHEMLMEQYGANSKIQQKIRERLKTGAYSDDVAQKLEARFGGQKGAKPQPTTPQTPQQNVYQPKPGDNKPETTDGGPMKIV